MKISVIICTHNPREDYLRRTLDALKEQTLPIHEWELLLIDNASAIPVDKIVDLTWHENSKIVRENKLGLTHARLRGIFESTGILLIFVDDDNILDPSYLKNALIIANKHQMLGAWSGSVSAEFEVNPEKEIIQYLHFLCIRSVERDIWSNTHQNLPHGAGMCVRRDVANKYLNDISISDERIYLDRTGDSLGGAGDLDLAMTSLDLGYGIGLFCSLKLIHLIPARRLTKKYILRFLEDGMASHVIFEHIRPRESVSHSSRIDIITSKFVAKYKYLRSSKIQKEAELARKRGLIKGKELLKKMISSNSILKND